MINSRKIFFRADAGPQIGYGHFIRTLALADMLKEDFDCFFVTVNPTAYQINEMSKVCRFIPLQAENHFDSFLSILQGEEIVVLDNYFFGTDYQRAIKEKGCKLVCIDDLHDKHYVADVVINQGVSEPSLFDTENYTRLCLGLEWALLRKPFIEAAALASQRTYSDKIETITVSFGGADYYGLTEKMIRILLQIDSIKKINAIVGDSFQSGEEWSNEKKVTLYRQIPAEKVAELFLNCDLAILSASTICIEALACGTRVAAGWYVDNQKDFYDYLKTNQIIYGFENCLHDSFITNIRNLVANTVTGNLNSLILKLNLKDVQQNYLCLFKMIIR